MRLTLNGKSRIVLSAACLALLTVSGCTGMREPQPESANRTVGTRIDDASIALALNRDLSAALPNFVSEIGTEVREGRVLIVGTVRLPQQRLEASKLAWQIRGVREVVNELEVSDGDDLLAHANDVRITNQMRLRMLMASGVTASNFSIETVNSRVYILGIAKDRDELEHVTYLAATIAGVEKVISHALLATDPRRLGRPRHASAVVPH